MPRVRVVAVCAALPAAGCSATCSSARTRTTLSPDYCRGTHPNGQVVVYSAPGLTYWYSTILGNFESNCAVQIDYESATSADLLVRHFTSWVYNTSARVDTSIDGFGSLALMTIQLGIGVGLDTARRMESNVAAHYESTDAMGHAVANGVALVANGDLAENLNDVTQYGHLGIWFPVVGGQRQALSVPFAAAKVASRRLLTARRADEEDNANALLAYMWSVAGQQAVGAAYGAPARPDVAPTDGRSRVLQAALAGVQIVRGDWEQLESQQAQLRGHGWPCTRRPTEYRCPL